MMNKHINWNERAAKAAAKEIYNILNKNYKHHLKLKVLAEIIEPHLESDDI